MTAGVKLFLLNCSHFETKVLKLTDFLGEYSSFWRQLFVLHAMSVNFLGFNLFKSLMVGEFAILGCLFLVDAFLTGDVFFTNYFALVYWKGAVEIISLKLTHQQGMN